MTPHMQVLTLRFLLNFWALMAIAWTCLAESETHPAMTLEDVDGRKRDIPTKSGKWQVWVIGSRDSAKDSAAWGQAVEAGFKNQLDIVSIAEISGIPKLLRSWVRGKVAREHGRFILIDWEGTLRKRLSLEGPFPHLIVWDPHGERCLQAHGAYSSEKWLHLKQKLEELNPSS